MMLTTWALPGPLPNAWLVGHPQHLVDHKLLKIKGHVRFASITSYFHLDRKQWNATKNLVSYSSSRGNVLFHFLWDQILNTHIVLLKSGFESSMPSKHLGNLLQHQLYYNTNSIRCATSNLLWVMPASLAASRADCTFDGWCRSGVEVRDFRYCKDRYVWLATTLNSRVKEKQWCNINNSTSSLQCRMHTFLIFLVWCRQCYQ